MTVSALQGQLSNHSMETLQARELQLAQNLQNLDPINDEQSEKNKMTKEKAHLIAHQIIMQPLSNQFVTLRKSSSEKAESRPRTITFYNNFAVIHMKEKSIAAGTFKKATNCIVVDLNTLKARLDIQLTQENSNGTSETPSEVFSSPHIQKPYFSYKYEGRSHDKSRGKINRGIKLDLSEKEAIITPKRTSAIGRIKSYKKPDGSPISLEDKIKVGIHLAKAIKSLHDQGYVVQDLNMGSGLFDFDDNGEIRGFLSDLDTVIEANAAAALPKNKRPISMGFTSLEVITGRTPHTFNSDRFGFGKILYHLFDMEKNADSVPDSVKELINKLANQIDPTARPQFEDIMDVLENEISKTSASL